MTPTTAITVRALVRLACAARRNREAHGAFSVNWAAYNAEFRAFLTSAQITARLARFDAMPPHQWNPWPNPRFDDIRIYQRCLTLPQNL